ncbi:MAG: FCD domain-containing protein [Neomegalonema sp.]|nr:FCD domain-containing protein [Neomegalonema sp.]
MSNLSDNMTKEAQSMPAAAEERLFMDVAKRILEEVQKRGLTSGDRLIPEIELAQLLSVSRATVREAIVALDVMGIVRVRRGASAVILTPNASLVSVTAQQDPHLAQAWSPVQIQHARILLEPEAASLAARHASEDDCAAMESAVERSLTEQKKGFMSEFGDRDFHLIIAKASHDSVLHRLCRDLWTMRRAQAPALAGMSKDQVEQLLQERRTRSVFEHMRILDAIRAKDPERAAQAMRDHIETTTRDLLTAGARKSAKVEGSKNDDARAASTRTESTRPESTRPEPDA